MDYLLDVRRTHLAQTALLPRFNIEHGSHKRGM